MGRRLVALLAGAYIVAMVLFPRTGSAIPNDLTGTSITVEWLFPDLATVIASDVVIVGAGVEIVCPGSANQCSDWGATDVRWDLGVDTISFVALENTGHAPATFNGFRFGGLAAGGPWGDVSLATDVVGLDLSRISFDGSTLLIRVGGLSIPANSFYTVTLVAPVPEPSACALVLSGLATLCAVARRRRSGMKSPIPGAGPAPRHGGADMSP
jgi:hypothetical protein